MKKYLIKGALALVATGFIVSCTHDDEYYGSIVERNTKAFAETFVKEFGTPAPNQNWGFNTADPAATNARTRVASPTRTNARTRTGEASWSVTNDFPVSFSRANYNAITTYLPEEVDAANKLNNYEFVSNGPFKFSFIYFQTSSNDVVGFYYYNPATQSASLNNITRVPILNGIKDGDYFKFLAEYSHGSQEKYPSWGITLDNNNNPEITTIYAKEFTIDAPVGYRVGFYIVNDKYNPNHTMYSNEQLNSDARPSGSRYYSAVVDKGDGTWLVGLEDWYFYTANDHVADCNDVIFSINTNATTTPPTIEEIEHRPVTTYKNRDYLRDVTVETGRIFCEDLANTDLDDMDYNDLVFNAHVFCRESHHEVKTFEDGILVDTDDTITDTVYIAKIDLFAAGGTIPITVAGKDVNEAFGVGYTTMVNTRDAETSSLSGASTVYRDPVSLGEFEHYKRILDIPVYVQIGGESTELMAETGQAPQKICVPITTMWTKERHRFGEAYPDFQKYVIGRSDTTWVHSAVAEHVYDYMHPISTEQVGDVNQTTITEDNEQITIFWKNLDGVDISSILYFTPTSLLIDEGIKAGDKLRFYCEKTADTFIFYLNDGNSGRVHVDQSYPVDEKHYLQVELTQDMVNKLKNNTNAAAFAVSGTGLKLTQVGLIKK